ncbi:MAG: hypothetical protein LBI33_05600 [Propionibacteriaceae bacterium]|nr:hypothetical protein [Propionibacteriaceae bacterium]
MNENTRLAKLYSRLADQADTPEQAEQRVRYLRLETSRWEDVGEANTRITSERQVIDQAVVERDLAAQTASDRIEQVTSSDGLNDSWWADWGAKVVAWITDVAGVIASIAGILALLVCWIPVIGQALAGVLMIIAAVAAVINALGNIALAATGERSWTEAVISIVGAVLACVGLGALKGSFSALKGAMGLWRSGGGVGAFGGLGGLSRAAWVGFTGAVKSAATNAAMRLLPTLRAMTGKTVLGRGIDDFVKFRSLMFNQRELRPIAGYHDVFVHGTPTSVIGDFEEELTAKQLAEIIRGGNWDGLESIRLVACQTGRGPFAQQLADELGVPVLAPLNDVWSSGRGKNLMEDWNRLAQLVERLPR